MAVKSSRHAKERAGERLNIAYKAKRNKLFNRALRYGHPPNDFAGEFFDYLNNKKKRQSPGNWPLEFTGRNNSRLLGFILFENNIENK